MNCDSKDMMQKDMLPAVLTEFKHDLNAYLAATPGPHPKNLTELIAFNKRERRIPQRELDRMSMRERPVNSFRRPFHLVGPTLRS
ncbi:hypothetical protein ABT158_50005 [Nonomuraea sp. NPDC001636]|uniref:hypothetical protein n=1 Tax=Nonomuraea sp. NPDC001636 TaxID=3154391 RepID=UPI00332B6726